MYTAGRSIPAMRLADSTITFIDERISGVAKGCELGNVESGIEGLKNQAV